MARIEHTNIIIDDFSIAKRYTNRVYTHILTHIHTDHLKGLHDGWNYGPIYCTPETKDMLIYRYPSLTCIKTLRKHEPTSIKMSDTLGVIVTLLDANHCVGAAMVLIEGYMGTILYTGDIRFNRSIFEQYTELYPPSLYNERFQACSKHIDVLYLDNTFLKKKFNFPPQTQALKMTIDFIQTLLNQNKHNRIFIGLDNIGKQEVIAAIARHYNIYVVVDEQRYELLKVMGFDPELFTTNAEEGFIEVVRKNKLYKKIQQVPDSIGIVLSGWVNHPTYKYKQTVYCIPYSLHSNYKEIHEFVNSIRPTVIYPIVNQYPDQNKLFYAENQTITKRDLIFKENLFECESGDYKSQIQELRRLYCSPPTPEYSLLINDVDLQKKIEEQLLPPKLPEFSKNQKFMAPVHLQTVERKKYKISNSRNQQQINRLRNQILMKKKFIEGERIDLVEDEGEQEVVESAPKNNSSKSVIDLDEIEIEPEVIEVDPFNEPISNSRPVNQKFKQLQQAPLDVHHDFNEARLIEQIKKKLKNNRYDSSSPTERTNTNAQHQIQTNILPTPKEQIFQAMRSKFKEKAHPFETKVKITASISDIRLEELTTIKIMDKKDDVSSYFSSNPQERAILVEYLGKQMFYGGKER